MAWAKVDDGWPHHPKAIAVGPLGRDLFICGLCYCRRHLTDGWIPDHVVPHLAPGLANPRKWAARLMEARLWERAEGGYRVHDFLKWNESAEEIRSKQMAERRRKREWWTRHHGEHDGRPLDASRNAPSDASSDASLDLTQPSPTQSQPNPAQEVKVPAEPAGSLAIVPARSSNGHYSARFSAVWHAYPLKVAKGAAWTAWRKQKVESLADIILAAVERQRPYLTREGGKYIPHLATYLNDRRWEDDPPEPAPAHRLGSNESWAGIKEGYVQL